MTAYDKIAHLIGTAALGLITVSASLKPGEIPAWLVIVAAVVAFATGVTTSPVMNKPTLGEAVDKAKLGAVLLVGLSLLASSCGTFPPPMPPAPVPVAGTPSCDAFNLIDDVGSDLVKGDWLSAVEDLARICGQAVVSLVVREVGGQSMHAAQASGGDSMAKLKADRARTYLLIYPVAGP